MPEVCFAITTQQFDSVHAMLVVRTLQDVGFIQFRVEAGPSAAGVELTVRIKQGMAAADAVIVSTLPALIVFTAVRRFGACLPGNTILFRRQLLFPLLVGLANFCHAGILPN